MSFASIVSLHPWIVDMIFLVLDGLVASVLIGVILLRPAPTSSVEEEVRSWFSGG